MTITIITLFPQVFDPILNSSILKRAQDQGKVSFKLLNLRDFGEGKHKVVDDRPFGGGAGMVLRADVLSQATKQVKNKKSKVILTSASGKPFRQSDAKRLSKMDHLIIICGHYEGLDQRFIQNYVDEELSIGDYVLTGGEIPTMVIVDSVVRLIPKVLKKEEATQEESFSSGQLEYPQYTRPAVFEGIKVPDVLLSGNHQNISQWRKQKSLEKTKKIRPDLLE